MSTYTVNISTFSSNKHVFYNFDQHLHQIVQPIVLRFRSELSQITESLYNLARPLPVRAGQPARQPDPQDILNPKVKQYVPETRYMYSTT